MAGPSIGVATSSGVLLGRERVDRAHRVIPDTPKHFFLAHHQRPLRAHDKISGRAGLAGTSLHWPTLSAPFLPAAIENRRGVEAENAQHPPHPCRPPRIGGAVEHDTRILVDAKVAHRYSECIRRGQHETKAMVLFRKIALQVDELCAGNMALFEIGPTRHNLIGDFRVGNEMGRAVENPEMGIIELPRQLLGRDQKLGMSKALAGGHADFPLSIGASIRATRPRAQLAPNENSSATRPWRWRR